MVLGLISLVAMVLDCLCAYADNCGSLQDCFGTMQSATGVGVGVAVMMAIGWLMTLFSEEKNIGAIKTEEQGEPGTSMRLQRSLELMQI